ncbi:AraC family transcriptional regulator [Sphingosinicella rhizophila]|uniref:AraC family transcriptional regulator n=1 Tax=Sphingosinicella rhizophila TaxID=3050082 RepID=A0ABU3QBD3_9SPHN|nr:AraC family transcriptional regulator [Sphingosinicella sp. GR2756]MDT9600714.1 AraC family transcriptional regulator [Sphingosinicella sp. GR2756]
MDVLTNVLSGMKLSGSVFLEADFSDPWCVTSQMTPEDCAAFFPQPAHVIAYHYVVSGRLLCAVGSDPAIEVRAGQIMLVPRNELHKLGSDFGCAPVAASKIMLAGDEGSLLRIVWGGGGEPTKILCGFLGTLTPINSFLLSLPSLLVIDASTGTSGEWLASSFRFASTEAAARSPEMIGRLAELLFAEAVKQYVQALPEEQGGWFAGLRDPHVSKALTLLHAHPAEAWTTESLARAVALSRSAFADRFTDLLGDPPMRYLSKHRMNIAANLLQEGRQNACNIAYAVGFNSEAAFSRAFKKEYGMAPGVWRKERCAVG